MYCEVAPTSECDMIDMYIAMFTASAVFWGCVTITLCLCSNQRAPKNNIRRAMSRRDTLTANGKLTLLNELCE